MRWIKAMLNKNLPYLRYFYNFLGYRLIALVLVSILVGLLDGFGLAMFMPLLEMLGNPEVSPTQESLGSLSFLFILFNAIGLAFSLKSVLLLMLTFFTLKGLALFSQNMLSVWYQRYFIKKIRINAIKALSETKYTYYSTLDNGEIQNMLTAEVGKVLTAFSSYMQVIKQTVLILSYCVLAFATSPAFTLFVAVLGAASNFVFYSLFKRTKILSQDLVKKNNNLQGLIIQYLQFYKYLKATGKTYSYARKLIAKVLGVEKINLRIGLYESLIIGAKEPLIIGIVVLVILIQVYSLGAPMSALILSLLFLYRALAAVTQLQTNYSRFLGASGSVFHMSSFVESLKRNIEIVGFGKLKENSIEIILRNCAFTYDGVVNVIEDISLEIKAKETVAFVGESGSGKTTLINMLSGLIQPTAGVYLLNGKNSSLLNRHSFQNKVGYITQEPIVFDDTIYNNVTFWKNKSEENVMKFREVMLRVNLIKDIDKLALKEDTLLSGNGTNLSGGQRQRLAIARELFKETDILLLDEATSSLDSKNENIVQNSIANVRGKVTLVIIAHRLSTIKNVDRIYLMDKGKIIERGTYKELIKRSEIFNNMTSTQLL